MSYPINYPTPQGANVQIFRAPSGTSTSLTYAWVKPQGASFVWFTLIGAGGNGAASTGGGSGAVTNFMCPAFLIPDELQITVAAAQNNTLVVYQQKNGAGYELIRASCGIGSSGASADIVTAFTAMGFFQSVAGQNGTAGGISASATTFLSGGGAAANAQDSNYGYSSGPAATNRNGFFLTQPIIVGTGGMGTGAGGVGCGGGSAGTGNGGSGLAVIITW